MRLFGTRGTCGNSIGSHRRSSSVPAVPLGRSRPSLGLRAFLAILPFHETTQAQREVRFAEPKSLSLSGGLAVSSLIRRSEFIFCKLERRQKYVHCDVEMSLQNLEADTGRVVSAFRGPVRREFNLPFNV